MKTVELTTQQIEELVEAITQYISMLEDEMEIGRNIDADTTTIVVLNEIKSKLV